MRVSENDLIEALDQFNKDIGRDFEIELRGPCTPCLRTTTAPETIIDAEDLVSIIEDATKLLAHLSHIEGEEAESGCGDD